MVENVPHTKNLNVVHSYHDYFLRETYGLRFK